MVAVMLAGSGEERWRVWRSGVAGEAIDGVDDAADCPEDGWGYRHLLFHRPARSSTGTDRREHLR
jgi:hypothetical protein